MVPDQPTTVSSSICAIGIHRFLKGHRIMVQVQSSWFPVIDRNPQTFVDIYKAKPSDFRKATHRVYRSAAQAVRREGQRPPLTLNLVNRER